MKAQCPARSIRPEQQPSLMDRAWILLEDKLGHDRFGLKLHEGLVLVRHQYCLRKTGDRSDRGERPEE